jgi:hypothetical protein
MHLRKMLGLVVAAHYLLGCSSSSSNSQSTDGGGANDASGSEAYGSVTGTALGQTLAVAGALSVIGTESEDGGMVGYAVVLLTSFTGICAYAQGPTHVGHGGFVLTISLTADTGPVTPQVYSVPARGSVLYGADSVKCQSTGYEEAQSGSVTLDTATSAILSGTFDVTFENGDHLTGSFSGPVCDTSVTSLSAPTVGCQP